MDKENDCVSTFGLRGHVGTPKPPAKLWDVTSMPGRNKDLTRTPLQDINNKDREAELSVGSKLHGLGKAAKILQYGQLTPLTVPTRKKTNKGNLQKMGILNFDSSSGSAPDRLSCRRTPHAQYRQMMGAFQHYKEDYEERLSTKDTYIKSLEEKLGTDSQNSSPLMSKDQSDKLENTEPDEPSSKSTDKDESDIQTVSEDSNSEATSLSGTFNPTDVRELTPLKNTDTPTIGTSPHRTPIPLKKWPGSLTVDGVRRRSSLSAFISYVRPSSDVENHDGTRSIGCSPIKIPVEHYESNSSSGEDMSPRDGQIVTNASNCKTWIDPKSESSHANIGLNKDSEGEKSESLDKIKCVETDCKKENDNICQEVMGIDTDTNAIVSDSSVSDNSKSEQMDIGVEKSINVLAIDKLSTDSKDEQVMDSGIGTSLVTTSSVTDSVGTITEGGIGTSLVATETESVGSNTEIRHFSDSCNNTSLIEVANAVTETLEVCSSNSGTNTVCINVETVATNTDSAEECNVLKNTQVVHASVNTDNVEGVNSSCNTSIIELQHEGTNTEIPSISESSMNTSSVAVGDIAVNTESADFVDCDMNTSLSGSVIARKENSEVGTNVTPKKYSDTAVLTSPSCLYVARPSDIGMTTFGEDDLKFQLESASISNTLLREELQLAHRNIHLHLIQTKQREVSAEIEKIKKLNVTTETRIKQVEVNTRANVEEQIESLMLQQGEYLNQISALEAELKSKTSTLQAIDEKHNKQVSWLKEQNSTLQSDLKLAYKQKKEEIQALEVKYSQEDYKALYHKSQIQLRKVQSQVQEFTDLVNVMQDSQQTQVEAQKVLEEGLKKVKEVAEKNQSDRKVFDEKLATWQEEKSKIESDSRVKHAEYEQMRGECMTISTLLEDDKTKITKLEEELQLAHEKVSIAEQAVEDFTAVNKTLIQGLDEKDSEIKNIETAKEELIKEVKEANGKIMSMTDLFEELEENLQKFKTEIIALQGQKTELNEKLDVLQERYDSDTIILQRTIDAREEEIDKITKTSESLQKICSKQKYIIESTQQELGQSQVKEKQLYVVQEQLQNLRQSAKENQEFIEQEHGVLEEENADLKNQNRNLNEEATTVAAENEKLHRVLQETSQKYQQLEAELDHVKTEAHLMLLQQGSEINAGYSAITRLSHRLQAMFSQLQLRSTKVLQNQVGDKINPEKELENNTDTASSSNLTDGEKVKSFLTSVLTAIEGETTDSPNTDTVTVEDTTEKHSEQSPKNSLGSSFSAFRKVQPGHTLSAEQLSGSDKNTSQNCANLQSNELVKQNSDEALENSQNYVKQSKDGQLVEQNLGKACENSQTASQSEMNKSKESGQGGEEGEEAPMSYRVDTLYKLVGQIISLVKVLDNTFTENEEKLQKQISELEKQLEFEKLDRGRFHKDQDDKVACLELQLIDSKQREKKLRSDLNTAKHQGIQAEQNLITVRNMCEEKTLALQKVADNQNDSQKLKHEVGKLQRALAQKSTECKIAQESLDDVLLKLEDKTQGKGIDSDMKYARENYLLKAEVNKLKQKLMFTKEEMDELASKANSRYKKLEYNYKKAEEEITLLDNTIDKLRYLLRRHRDMVRTWPDAKDIWNEVVYDKRLDDSSMKWT